jgi:hypothetical protein
MAHEEVELESRQIILLVAAGHHVGLISINTLD